MLTVKIRTLSDRESDHEVNSNLSIGEFLYDVIYQKRGSAIYGNPVDEIQILCNRKDLFGHDLTLSVDTLPKKDHIICLYVSSSPTITPYYNFAKIGSKLHSCFKKLMESIPTGDFKKIHAPSDKLNKLSEYKEKFFSLYWEISDLPPNNDTDPVTHKKFKSDDRMYKFYQNGQIYGILYSSIDQYVLKSSYYDGDEHQISNPYDGKLISDPWRSDLLYSAKLIGFDSQPWVFEDIIPMIDNLVNVLTNIN